MHRRPGTTSVFLLIALLLFPAFAPILETQSQAQSAPQPAPPPPPTPQQLDQLLAPIALYPDALLAQITTASTNPQEILDVTNWLAKNPNLTGTALTDAAEKQGFDPAFLALVTFPTVLQMMADNIDDYAAIGQAMTANQAEVAASIQRLRSQAYAAGALRTNDKQTVEVQQVPNQPQPVYVIQPANPQVVYVPQYNPTVVYVAPSTSTVVATSLITFGVGIGIGVLLANNHPWGWGGWGWGWGHGVYYNRGPWGGVWVGGYRPPVYWYHPRPPYYVGRPGYGGNWHYHPPYYRPPYPTHRPVYRPPSSHPGYRPPTNRPPGYRPPPTTQPATPALPPLGPLRRAHQTELVLRQTNQAFNQPGQLHPLDRPHKPNQRRSQHLRTGQPRNRVPHRKEAKADQHRNRVPHRTSIAGLKPELISRIQLERLRIRLHGKPRSFHAASPPFSSFTRVKFSARAFPKTIWLVSWSPPVQ